MEYNINIFVEKKEKKKCRICNKKVNNLKVHHNSKYCLGVKKILDKLTPTEVGLLKTGKKEPYTY